MDAEGALALLDGVDDLYVAKGKKTLHFDLKNDRPSDEEILAASPKVARGAAVCGEPAGVTAFAALEKAAAQGRVERTSKVVVWPAMRTGTISSAGTLRYSATEETRREYQTVAVTCTGPGGSVSGSFQVNVSLRADSGASR